MGFSPRQVVAIVLLEHVALGLVAAVSGWFVAGLFTSRLQAGVAQLLHGSAFSFGAGGLAYTVIAVLVALLVATLVPALQWARIAPDRALRDIPVGMTRNSRIARVIARIHAPLPVVLGARDLASRSVRTVLSVGAAVVGVVFVVTALGLMGSMQRLADNPRLTGEPWHAQSPIPQGFSRESYGSALLALPEVAAWYTDEDVKASVDGQPFLARIMGGEQGAANFVVRGGRAIHSAGEAMVGYGFMQKFGVGIDDQVTFSLSGEAISVRVVGWYSETEDSGVVLRVREDSLPTGIRPVPSDVRIVARAGTSSLVLARLVAERFGIERVGALTSDSDFDEFITALRAMVVLIGAVVVAHLSVSMITTVRERTRRPRGAPHNRVHECSIDYAVKHVSRLNRTGRVAQSGFRSAGTSSSCWVTHWRRRSAPALASRLVRRLCR